MTLKKHFVPGILMLLFIVASCKKNSDDNSLSSNDINFLTTASYSNYNEIDGGNLAAIKGSADSVVMFGNMMVTDHTTAQRSLDSLGSQFNVNLPSGPDSAHLALHTQLSALSGYSFDTTYISRQVIDHNTTVALFQNEIAAGKNQKVINFAITNLPMIEMHLQLADSINNSLH